MTNVFAVVVNYNGAPWLERCLDSLRHSEHPISIVVVDNASQDESVAMARSVDGVEVIQQAKNLGFGRANNVGIAHALGKGAEFVFLLNQDAEVEPSTISLLLGLMRNRDDAGIASPVHLNDCGTLLDSKFLLDYLAPQAPRFISDAYAGDLAGCYQVSSVNAAAWLISRRCLEVVGGFDPIFFMYGEDDDFCARVDYHGFSCYVVSQARIRHARGFHHPAYRGGAWRRLSRTATFSRAQAIRRIKDPTDRSTYRSAYKVLTTLVLEGLGRSLASLSPSPFLPSIVAAARVCWDLPRIKKHKRACQFRGPTWLEGPLNLLPDQSVRNGAKVSDQSRERPGLTTEQLPPVVTVGVPIYNGAMFLEGALESLLSQTFDSFEILISDNGSDDGTEQICRRFAAMDSRIRYLRHGVNRGAVWNHNFLISEARGRYFRWHHCDDRCEPRHLELCVAALESDPIAVLAYPRTILIDAAGKVTSNYSDRLALWEESALGRLRHLLRNVYLCNPVLGVIRTDALRRTALLGSYIRSDHVLLAELAMEGRWIEVPEMLFRRRIHAGKSTEANRSDRDRAAWLDPKLRSKMIIWPNVQLFLEHLKAVWRAKIGLRQRVLCMWTVVAWQSRVETLRLRERFRRLRAGVAARMGLEFGTGKPANKRNGTF